MFRNHVNLDLDIQLALMGISGADLVTPKGQEGSQGLRYKM